jgi:hypothetical protein
MKADQYGTPAEQTRHQADWRTAEKNGPRCDGCVHVEMNPNGNGKWAAHCTALELATKPNATCDHHEPIRIGGTQPQQERDDMAISDSKPTGKAPSVSADSNEQEARELEQLPSVGEMLAETGEAEAPISDDHVRLSEMVGMLKATAVQEKFLNVFRVKMLSEIKESKKYKGLPIVGADGKVGTVQTWADFCGAMGYEPTIIDENIRNLSILGEEFLQFSNRIGLGYRDLRKLRKLPEEDRAVVLDQIEVDVGDKQAIVSLIDDLAAKHAKEKEELTKKLDTAEKELQASRNRTERLRQEKEKLEEAEELRKLTPALPDEEAERLRAELSALGRQTKATVMTEMRRGIKDLLELGNARGVDEKPFAAGLLIEIMLELNILRSDFLLPAKLDADPTPVWARPGFDPLKAARGEAQD